MIVKNDKFLFEYIYSFLYSKHQKQKELVKEFKSLFYGEEGWMKCCRLKINGNLLERNRNIGNEHYVKDFNIFYGYSFRLGVDCFMTQQQRTCLYPKKICKSDKLYQDCNSSLYQIDYYPEEILSKLLDKYEVKNIADLETGNFYWIENGVIYLVKSERNFLGSMIKNNDLYFLNTKSALEGIKLGELKDK